MNKTIASYLLPISISQMVLGVMVLKFYNKVQALEKEVLVQQTITLEMSKTHDENVDIFNSQIHELYDITEALSLGKVPEVYKGE